MAGPWLERGEDVAEMPAVGKTAATGASRRNNPLEFAPLRCYICGMLVRNGWMLRITGPILG